MSLADQIRAFVINRYLDGSPLGFRLRKAADDIEMVERGVWPIPQKDET